MPETNYYDNLPTKLYGQPLTQTIDKVKKRQNILVSGVPGAGRETFLKMLMNNLQSAIKTRIVVWDMGGKQSVDSLPKSNEETLLIMNKLFLLKSRAAFLEKLHAIQLQSPNLTVVALTNHTGITNPEGYFAKTHPFFQSICHILPFSEDDTQIMIDANRSYYGWSIAKKYYKKIYRLTGGVARLIKYVCSEITDNNLSPEDYDRFMQNPAILFELKILYALLMNESKEHLKQLRIINTKGKIRSMLLQRYFKQQTNIQETDLKRTLTPQEQTLFNYLLANKGQLISVDKIASLIAMSDDNFSLWKIYKLISRLKPKLKPTYALETVRGKGYRLMTNNKTTP
ncbi:helix-turn-helix domain-containing protein [candidate division WWE3 bacterium]|uniref:Helix-turn-helix domain-containing protein n=1 Tax=candidate division WWE3 bacterium TaxID=2053526 RepID=A0A955LJI2_UNCKA|nr:helix-turn-helix domain-containing protein [candidate division WWE3 bacterium]